MFEFEACEVLKIKEFTFVNDCFHNKHNEKIGHYGQTLIIVEVELVVQEALVEELLQKQKLIR